MPDDGPTQLVADAEPPVSGRSGRTQVLAFVTDAESEAALRLGLRAIGPEDFIVQ